MDTVMDMGMDITKKRNPDSRNWLKDLNCFNTMTWFASKKTTLSVDLHSHLIPGIDDGAESFEDSLQLLKAFVALGYKKVITTPHIHPNYQNTEEKVLERSEQLQNLIAENKIEIDLNVAAEYFVDEDLIDRVKGGDKLLSFGDNYLLIECSFINKPLSFSSDLFTLKSLGYRPLLAHPERYRFLEGSISWLEELKESDILFQVTLGSLVGYYGEEARKVALVLMKKGMVDFLASDLHKMSQVPYLKKGLELRKVHQYCNSGRVLNDSLM